MSPADRPPSSPPVPRRRWRILGLGLGALVLVAVFFAWGLPRDRLRRLAERELASSTAAEVTVGSLSPALSRRGPAVRLANVALRWPNCLPVELEAVELAPAWSLGWLRGPVLRLTASGDLGHLDGTLRVHLRRAFRGTLRGLDLRELMAITTVWLLQGSLDADLDLVQDGLLPRGTAVLRGRDGLIRIPKLVSPIVFDRLEGTLELGGSDAYVRIPDLRLESQLARVRIAGSIGYAPVPDDAPLRLDGRIHVDEPGVRSVMRLEGLTFDDEGNADFRVRGTLGLPVLE